MKYLEEALQRQQRLVFPTIYHQGLYLPDAHRPALAAVCWMWISKSPFPTSVLRGEPWSLSPEARVLCCPSTVPCPAGWLPPHAVTALSHRCVPPAHTDTHRATASWSLQGTASPSVCLSLPFWPGHADTQHEPKPLAGALFHWIRAQPGSLRCILKRGQLKEMRLKPF